MSGRIAVIQFPGTNCELDAIHGLQLAGGDAELVFHRETSLSGYDAVVLPGGFAHGDYLRTGAIARFSPVMDEVITMAEGGAPVLGICNGFQILCEAGLLPGALVENRDLKFICRPVTMRVEQTTSVLTAGAETGQLGREKEGIRGAQTVIGDADRVFAASSGERDRRGEGKPPQYG